MEFLQELKNKWLNDYYRQKSILENTQTTKYYLECIFDTRKDFYKKAQVIEHNGILYLKSYETIVAIIYKDFAYAFGWYSQTTARHINEFLKQNGFETKSKKELTENKIFVKE